MVGKTYAQRLKKLDINRVKDLLHHYPFRYNDYSVITPINQIKPRETVTIQGQILACQNVYTKTGKKIQKAIIRDSSGQIETVWFNQPFLAQTLKAGVNVSLSGKVDWFGRNLSLVSPEYEIINAKNAKLEAKDAKKETIHTGRLVPVYPETYGVSSKWLRSRIAPLIKKLVPQIPDWLPENIKKEESLINLNPALQKIHFPNNRGEILNARKRLAFDELFLIQLSALKRKKVWQKTKLARSFSINQKQVLKFINSLAFKLTSAQDKTSKEILADLKRKQAMNRLLEGDVGSGKTVVAAIAMYTAYLNGFQSALMAPTEILAYQHYETIKTLLEPFKVKVELLTGSRKTLNSKTATLKKQKPLRSLKNSWDIIIGTHALIYNQIEFHNLGLVVVDEQHRFGVEQRAKLIKKGKAPHLLTMTATPIPRTIALTLYGDLDLSVLDEMPPGRKKTKTWIVPLEKRKAAYDWIEKQVKPCLPAGRKEKSQVFIVCPLIEESDKELMKDIRAATVEFERLKKVFPKFKLELLHGRLKSKQKEKVITLFKNKKLDILVSTPVVEVGIDIPNAHIMVIEGADRFGLAQLHQLRGRVGRSDKQSYCLLFASQKNKQDLKRLQAMQKHHSGFKLAEIDLKLRGAGEIYGTRQHGFIQLKIASFSDADLISKTRKNAEKIINKINQFPLLKQKLKNYTIRGVEPN